MGWIAVKRADWDMKFRYVALTCLVSLFFSIFVFAGDRASIQWRPVGEERQPEYLDLEAYPDDPVTVHRNRVGIPGFPWTEPVTGMEFVWVPGGCFEMGSPSGENGRANDEGPVHRVELGGFWMGKYEVTQAEWQRVMGNNPSYFKGAAGPWNR